MGISSKHLAMVAFVMASGAAALNARANLIINPTFDASIQNDPQSAAIESTINQAVQTYYNTFADNITVNITFQESTTGSLGGSNWTYYSVPYSTFLSALKADATTSADATALSTLPNSSTNPVTGTSSIYVKSANMRSLALNGPSAGASDGTVTFNSTLTDPPNASGSYPLLPVVEHEIDEVLGIGSSLDFSTTNPLPEDLFRYTSSGTRSYTTSGDNAYFSIDGTNDIVQFNQNQNTPEKGDYGDWHLSNTPRVQDAFATPGASPSLGYAEITALDVIGYDAVPEPASLGCLAVGGLVLLARRRRRA